ncbi:hypothetical protein GGP41_008032 [Bipolaris sorokiniana]|uniref:Uncharacterized protein n=1 Tax=Cochliobolus sativus TaxID=45130 RepID=A0A8H5ZNU8_COCSA|nr:hypothetical protein GGP41_008032 [Bipolaris sorokiniana]
MLLASVLSEIFERTQPEPTPQVTDKMWALIFQVHNFYTDIVDFLYWNVYDEICDLFLRVLLPR